MHLKTLEIQGFKSFPERTVIEYHEGITAIVGPNGSGKSNITDAIRWVLGEQSVRTLRGSRMEDVIFSGTQTRRAMGYAEVTMTLDNTDGFLPTEYSEISVTRRLYRSGESEYLLNRTTCRLKDIMMLFMDTGLGRDGYSIIGQGRVDELLSTRSEDRRRVFEEASGIVKFKMRKEEAERKLASTEQNLLRIADILRELRLQLDPLEEQAVKAREFLRLRDRLKGIEIAMCLDQVDRLGERLAEAEGEWRDVQDRLFSASRAVDRMKEENRRTAETLRELDAAVEERRGACQSLSDRIRDVESQDAVRRERMAQIESRLSGSLEESGDLVRSVTRLEEELASRARKDQVLQVQRQGFEDRIREAEADMAVLLERLDQEGRDIEALKVRLDAHQETLFDKRGTSRQVQGQVGLVDNRQRTLAAEIQDMIQEGDRCRLEEEEVLSQLAEAGRAVSAVERTIASCQARLESARKAAADTALRLETCRMDLANRQFRAKTLSDLDRSHEGYAESVRFLLGRAEADPVFGAGIRGTVGNLLRVEREHETAIEVALGGAVQNLVTDTEETASRLIATLRQEKAGRATFLPMASIRGRRLEETTLFPLRAMAGFVGLGSDLVRHPEGLEGIVDQLLGRVAVVQSLDQAIAVARRFQYAFRIVTLSGDVISPGGAMTGGETRQGRSGLLGRSREIEALGIEVAELERLRIRLDAEAAETMESMKQAARDLEEADAERTRLTHVRIREEARHGALRDRMERTAARRTLLETERNQLGRQREALLLESRELEQAAAAIEADMAGIRSHIAAHEERNREDQGHRDELRESISDLRVSLGSIDESLAAAAEMRARIESDLAEVRRTIGRREEERNRNRAELEDLAHACEGAGEERSRLAGEREAENALLEALLERRRGIETEMDGYVERLEAETSRQSTLTAEMGRIEVRKSRCETGLDEVRNRLWEEYELTAETASPWRAPVENPATVQREIAGLRQSIRDLGVVNVGAVEELDRVRERHDFMETQRNDIEGTALRLRSVITELSQEMKKQFLEHFHSINANFNQVFSELFGGGMAEISLQDEDNVLECGIDIRAQPPGKRLQNMMLLSGGERCLTAIAILFAILRLRPTPFCVLDEIEAALDDVNVTRFNDYIRRLADDSQFILVTHRKGTMEAADRLYGVTMQERGVSRVLSMVLAE